MTVNSSEITFFTGAGASKPFGIPTMIKMTEIFGNRLKSQEKELFDNIIKKLKKIQTQIDIETVFSLIERFSANEYLRFEDPLFYYWKIQNKLPDHVCSTRQLSNIKVKLQNNLRNACVLKSSKHSKLFQIYSNFFITITKGLNPAPSIKSSDIPYDNLWTIFTTNYDICLETFWRDKYEIDIFTGFFKNGKEFAPDNFFYSDKGELLNRTTQFQQLRLVKLHESINWLINRETGKVEEKEYNLKTAKKIGRGFYDKEVLMYPLIEKELYVDPYIQMFYCLNKELENKRVCLTIGYSFRDPIIRNFFIKNF